MSAPSTDRLRIPAPRPRPSGPRHQKPDEVAEVAGVRVVQTDAERDPETVALSARDLRAAVPTPRTPAPATRGLRPPTWDLLPPASRVDLRVRS